MRRKYLVLKDVRDCKHSSQSYAVVSVVELDERVLPVVDSVLIPEQVAQALRETRDKHAKPER
jgi:hypothetical protein